MSPVEKPKPSTSVPVPPEAVASGSVPLGSVPSEPAPTASLWRNRDFNLLWGGQALSGLGSSMATLAYPLVVLALTGSAVTAGVVGTVALVVQLVLTLPAGVLVDRVNRRRLLITCDLVRLLAFAVLGIALATGHGSLGLVIGVAVIEAMCDTPFFNAAMAAVRNLVPTAQVPAAMARNEARQYAVSLVGPPLGGVAFGLGRAVPFLANALSYLLSLGSLLLIRRPLQQRHEGETHGSALHDLGEGLRFIVRDPFTRAAVLIAGPLNLGFNGILFGIVLVLRGHGLSPGLIGTAETIFGVGGLLGAICAAWLMQHFSTPTLIRAICIAGVPLLLAVRPLSASPAATVPVALLAFLAPALNAGLFGHLASVVPDRVQGRVMSALMMAATGMASLAPLAAGVLVHRFGATGLVIGAAGCILVAAAVAITSKGIREIHIAGDQPPPNQ